MFELLLVLLAVGALAGVVWIPWLWWIQAGFVLAVLGLAIGLLGGVPYHLRLRAALLRASALPPRWWWQPTRLHDRVPEAERDRVLAPFVLGAAGFGVTLLGCVAVVLGIAASLLDPGLG